MADWFVDDAAADNTGTGAWNDPLKYLWLADGAANPGLFNLATPPAAGDRVFVLTGHIETHTAGFTTVGNGVRDNPINIISVTSFNSGAPVTLGAKSSCLLHLNAALELYLANYFHIYGFHINGGNNIYAGLVSPWDFGWVVEQGRVSWGTSSSTGRRFRVSGSDGNAYLLLVDSDLQVDTVDYVEIATGGTVYWEGGELIGNPTALVKTLRGGVLRARNVDLTAATNNLVDATEDRAYVLVGFERCKIGIGVTLIVNNNSPGTFRAYMDSCDTGNGYHYFEQSVFEGDVTEDTGVYRDGGATYDGTNPFSANVFPATSVSLGFPLRWNIPGGEALDLTTAKTLTLHYLIDSAVDIPAALTEHELWIRATHPDGTTQALGVVIESKTADMLATPADNPASTETWTGARAFTRKQQVAVTFPALAGVTNGIITVEVCVAAAALDAGDLLYVCPDWVIS